MPTPCSGKLNILTMLDRDLDDETGGSAGKLRYAADGTQVSLTQSSYRAFYNEAKGLGLLDTPGINTLFQCLKPPKPTNTNNTSPSPKPDGGAGDSGAETPKATAAPVKTSSISPSDETPAEDLPMPLSQKLLWGVAAGTALLALGYGLKRYLGKGKIKTETETPPVRPNGLTAAAVEVSAPKGVINPIAAARVADRSPAASSMLAGVPTNPAPSAVVATPAIPVAAKPPQLPTWAETYLPWGKYSRWTQRGDVAREKAIRAVVDATSAATPKPASNVADATPNHSSPERAAVLGRAAVPEESVANVTPSMIMPADQSSNPIPLVPNSVTPPALPNVVSVRTGVPQAPVGSRAEPRGPTPPSGIDARRGPADPTILVGEPPVVDLHPLPISGGRLEDIPPFPASIEPNTSMNNRPTVPAPAPTFRPQLEAPWSEVHGLAPGTGDLPPLPPVNAFPSAINPAVRDSYPLFSAAPEPTIDLVEVVEVVGGTPPPVLKATNPTRNALAAPAGLPASPPRAGAANGFIPEPITVSAQPDVPSVPNRSPNIDPADELHWAAQRRAVMSEAAQSEPATLMSIAPEPITINAAPKQVQSLPGDVVGPNLIEQ